MSNYTGLPEEERIQLEKELTQLDEEITKLRAELSEKVYHQRQLKQKLGITVFQEIQRDLNHGIDNIKQSTIVTKVTTAINDAGDSVNKKWEDVRNSEKFQTIEGKVGQAYANVKSTLTRSRENSSAQATDLHTQEAPDQSPNAPSS